MANTGSFTLRSGFKKAKGTAPAAGDLYGGTTTPSFGAGTELLVAEPKIEMAPTMLDDESINGTQFATGQDLAMLPVKVSGSHELRVKGSGQILFSALGYESLQGPIASGAKYAHLILVDPMGKDQRKYTAAEIAQDNTITANDYLNRYFHFVQKMGMGNRIARNATIKEFTLTAESKAALKLDFSGSAQDYELDPDFSQTASMSLPGTIAEMKRFRFSDLQTNGCWIGVWNDAGTALTQAKECVVSFNVQQNFGQAEGVGTSCSGLYQAEPIADGMNEMSVEISRYKVDTDEWLSRMTAGTEIALKALFKVGDYELRVFLPRLKINNVQDQLGDGGRINITCKALVSKIANDPFVTDRTIGSTEMTIPFDTSMYCILIDDEDTNYARTV